MSEDTQSEAEFLAQAKQEGTCPRCGHTDDHDRREGCQHDSAVDGACGCLYSPDNFVAEMVAKMPDARRVEHLPPVLTPTMALDCLEQGHAHDGLSERDKERVLRLAEAMRTKPSRDHRVLPPLCHGQMEQTRGPEGEWTCRACDASMTAAVVSDAAARGVRWEMKPGAVRYFHGVPMPRGEA